MWNKKSSELSELQKDVCRHSVVIPHSGSNPVDHSFSYADIISFSFSAIFLFKNYNLFHLKAAF